MIIAMLIIRQDIPKDSFAREVVTVRIRCMYIVEIR